MLEMSMARGELCHECATSKRLDPRVRNCSPVIMICRTSTEVACPTQAFLA